MQEIICFDLYNDDNSQNNNKMLPLFIGLNRHSVDLTLGTPWFV